MTPEDLEKLKGETGAEADTPATPESETGASGLPGPERPGRVTQPFGTAFQPGPSQFGPLPNPYGYPYRAQNEPKQYQVAPSGKPYIVQEHPNEFYSYKNKEGKQVYAAYASVRTRFYAALFDTVIIFLPLQFLADLIIVLTDPNLAKMFSGPSSAYDQAEFSRLLNEATPGWIPFLVLTISMLYNLLLIKKWGQTLGKKILRIKVIAKDGGPPKFQPTLNRSLFGYAGGMGYIFLLYGAAGTLIGTCLLVAVMFGFFAIINNPQRQGWHDRLADTLVVGQTELVQGVNY